MGGGGGQGVGGGRGEGMDVFRMVQLIQSDPIIQTKNKWRWGITTYTVKKGILKTSQLGSVYKYRSTQMNVIYSVIFI